MKTTLFLLLLAIFAFNCKKDNANPAQLDSITIKNAPNKVDYYIGDNLDLTGLVISLTQSNGTTEDVPFSDFESKGITTNPSNGTVLTNSNTTITITHTYSLKTTNQAINVTEITVTDIDGNVYHTVAIGTQVWMLENLKTTKYRDGTSIPNVTNNEAWQLLTTGAYCDYDNTPTNSATYGKLYNWYAATNAHNIAPTGWHVPTDEEWNTLTTYLGGESVAGGMLKEIGTTHWASPNTGATNATGFTALPGGYRFYNGLFYDIGKYSGWWSSTEPERYVAWYREILYNFSDAHRYGHDERIGFSVRCVKD